MAVNIRLFLNKNRANLTVSHSLLALSYQITYASNKCPKTSLSHLFRIQYFGNLNSVNLAYRKINFVSKCVPLRSLCINVMFINI